METCIALLRGINVGGKNLIKMEDLKSAFEELCFKNVRTYIASGNVIFDSPAKEKSKLKGSIEKKLLQRYGTKLPLVIINSKELKTIIEKAPKDFGKEKEKYRYDVWFLIEPLTAKEVLQSIKPREGVDTITAGSGVVYSTRLTSMMGKSHLSKISQLPLYESTTIRSWNTVIKLSRMV